MHSFKAHDFGGCMNVYKWWYVAYSRTKMSENLTNYVWVQGKFARHYYGCSNHNKTRHLSVITILSFIYSMCAFIMYERVELLIIVRSNRYIFIYWLIALLLCGQPPWYLSGIKTYQFYELEKFIWMR